MKPHSLPGFLGSLRFGTLQPMRALDSQTRRLSSRVCTASSGLPAGPGGAKAISMRQEAGLRRLKELAAARGGQCLAEQYRGIRAKVPWQCELGHIWYAQPDNIQYSKTWCPVCAGSAPLGMQRLHDHAASKGGLCLASAYRNTRTKMRWQCSDGHQWEATPANIMYVGSWCPKCALQARAEKQKGSGRKRTCKRLGLLDLQAHAATKHGLCLAASYQNSATKVLWQCEFGHQWSSAPKNVLYKGTWCPHCARKASPTLQHLQDHASALGGECTSEGYVNLHSHLNWKCKVGHVWQASAASVIHHGSWCPFCAGKAPIGLARLQAHAASLGGECLSTTYTNKYRKLLWRCALGHTWTAIAGSVLHGRTWCPHCAAMRWRNESEVRQIFEAIFAPARFGATFPGFLGGLQLDGYNPELRLAFEYHGAQHYEPDNYFHFGDVTKFHGQQERDNRKEQLCAQAGVRLLVVPYFVKDKQTFVRLALLRWFRMSDVNPRVLSA